MEYLFPCQWNSIAISISFSKINENKSYFYTSCRRTLRTYFWRKVGGILDYDFRRTCPRITEYWTQIGCTISGGPIASSRTRRRSPSTRCRYRIIIFGCITTKPCFTCRSKIEYFDFSSDFCFLCSYLFRLSLD